MTSVALSVVVPVYKTEDYLPSAIDSLLASCPARGVEIILVSDGSPGPVEAIVASYKDQRLRYLAHDTNRGLLAARVTGARHARGLRLAHLDPDDLARSHYFDTLLGQIDNPADLVEFNATRVRKTDVVAVYPSGGPIVKQDTVLDAFLNQNMVGNVWNKLYKTELWNRVFEAHSFDDHIVLAEDFVINILYCFYARTYDYKDDFLTYYMVRANSSSQSSGAANLNISMNQLRRSYNLVLRCLFSQLLSKQKASLLELFMTNVRYSVINRTSLQSLCEDSTEFDCDNLLFIGSLFACKALHKG